MKQHKISKYKNDYPNLGIPTCQNINQITIINVGYEQSHVENNAIKGASI